MASALMLFHVLTTVVNQTSISLTEPVHLLGLVVDASASGSALHG